MRLTESEVSFFHDNGYLLLEDVLDENDLGPVVTEYSEIIAERAERLHKEGKVTSTYADKPFTERLLHLAAEASEVTGDLDIMRARGEATFNFLKNPKILDLAESFVGSEIVCNPIQHIRAVLPIRDSQRHPTPWQRHPTPWHQDAGVCWPDIDPYFMLTIWIPIVDTTLENGCLQVLPGSHKMGLFTHTWNDAGLVVLPEHQPPNLTPKVLPIRAGGVILFHNYTLHSAKPNESETVRWSFDLRYHDVYQPTGRPYYPAFLMRSRLRPEACKTDYGTWCKRWEFALENSKGVQAYRWPR
ncbi:mitomycin antibiotic biosynthesis protein [Candidatus Poribacteria bacterium]|nr:MAG: mitomycin antibiotic biosynthesis protein [Candidatus Poribacteria bacterium]